MAEYSWVCALALFLSRCGTVLFGVICPQLKADYSCWQSSHILVPGVGALVRVQDLLAGSLQLLSLLLVQWIRRLWSAASRVERGSLT